MQYCGVSTRRLDPYRLLQGKVKIETATVTVPERPYSVPVERTERLPFRVRCHKSSRSRQSGRNPVVRLFTARPRGRGDVERGGGGRLPFGRAVDLCRTKGRWPSFRLGQVAAQSEQAVAHRRRNAAAGKIPRPAAIEFMRLGVENGIPGQLVTAALVKAGFEICHAAGFDFILAAGRRSVSMLYHAMAFDDVLDGGTVALSYANHLPHGIFSIPVNQVDRRLPAKNPGLYAFMARTHHPDISIDYEHVHRTFG